MAARTELDRLAAARPYLLDHTELVVDAEQERQICRQIQFTARPGPASLPAAMPGPWRPRVLLAAAAAVVVAAAGVTTAVIGTGSGRAGHRSQASHGAQPGHGTTQATLAVAVLRQRTATAVAGAVSRDILYTRTVYAAGTAGSTGTIEVWMRGYADREESFNTHGSLTDLSSAVVDHGLRVRRFVDYPSRTWQQDSIQLSQYGAGPTLSQMVKQLLGPEPKAPHKTITLVTLHGRRMYRVTFRLSGVRMVAWRLPIFTASEYLPAMTGGRIFSESMWIDATSFLPLRVAVTGHGGKLLASETVAWLPADPANLAKLVPAAIPAGFSLTPEPAH